MAKPIAVTNGAQTFTFDDLPAAVELDASASTGDAAVTAWAWTLLDKPAGSTATITDADAETASLTADLVGTYLIFLTVTAAGETSETDLRLAPATAYARISVTTEALGLSLPGRGERDWAARANANFAAIDAAIGGLQGLAGSTYDWADSSASDYPAEDQLGGAMSLAGWSDVQTKGGDVALVALELVENGRRLAIRWPKSDDASGAIRQSPAGNWRYAFRIAPRLSNVLDSATESEVRVQVVHVDGTDVDADKYYGLSMSIVSDVPTNRKIERVNSNNAGNQWDGAGFQQTDVETQSRAQAIDVLLVKTLYKLDLYWGPARECSWNYAGQFSGLGNGAGLVGIRIKTISGNAEGCTGTVYVDAFRRFAASPL